MSVSKNAIIIGAGQIGTFITRSLTNRQYTVHAVDNNPDLGFFNLFGSPDASLYEVDICDSQEIYDFIASIENCELVIFSCGLSGQKSMEDPQLARSIYIDGFNNVLNAVEELQIPRLVFISSLSVYSSATNKPFLDESMDTVPHTEYGKILCEAEDLLLNMEGTERIIARIAGVYGPKKYGSGSHSANLFERLIHSAHLGRVINTSGSLLDEDDYVYIKDVAEAISLICTSQDKYSLEVVNIGEGRVSSLDRVIKAVEKNFANVTFTHSHNDHLPNLRVPLGIDKLKNQFGYTPKFPIEEGIKDYAIESGLIKL
jgi:nucleoside-diphosphate-sugar epimerase